MKHILVLSVLVLGFLGCSAGGGVVGSWEGSISNGTQSLTSRATLNVANSVVTGTFTLCGATCDTSISLSGTSSGNAVNFVATFNGGGQVTANAAVNGSAMTGTVIFQNGSSGQLSMTRK